MVDDGHADRSYERLLLSFHAMGGGLWDYDLNADRLQCNARWHRILGLVPDPDKILKLDDFRRRIHPDDAAFATALDPSEIPWSIDEDGDQQYNIQFRIIRPTGETRWVRSTGCLIEDKATGHRRAIGCMTDITEYRAGTAIPPTTGAPTAPEASDRAASISAKEKECLMWVSLGKTAWETAGILGISPRTVEFHLANAIAKLDASNKIHAAAIAIRMGLI